MASDTQWYVAVNGQQEGPMSADEVAGRVSAMRRPASGVLVMGG